MRLLRLLGDMPGALPIFEESPVSYVRMEFDLSVSTAVHIKVALYKPHCKITKIFEISPLPAVIFSDGKGCLR